ncbi:hypothetical protein ACFLWO_04325 [Chloroflexota bacterium]
MLLSASLVLGACVKKAPEPIPTPGQTTPSPAPTPDSTTQYDQVNTGLLDLRQKSPDTGETVGGGASGTMVYNLSGPTFNFEFYGKGLETETSYSLIYYAAAEVGHNNLRSDIPGALIAKGKSNLEGNIQLKGSVNLDMDLPHSGDANYDYLDCCGEYGAGHGAKIWLVPSDCYDSTNMVIWGNKWKPNRFLFETELITYDDTNA